MQDAYFIGIDGGGTKTESVLADSEGRILSYRKTGPSAIVGRPSRKSVVEMKEQVSFLCRKAGITHKQVDHCVIGLNGIDFDFEYRDQKDAFVKGLGFPERKFSLVNDGIVALWGASRSRACVILQHGSGLTSAYRDQYGSEKLFDHLDSCRCFDIRNAVLVHAARMIKGLEPETALAEEVMDHFGVTREEYAERFFLKRLSARNQGEFLVETVFRLWLAGDRGAGWLVRKALEDYSAILNTMIRLTRSSNAAAVLGGGVLKSAPERFWRAISKKIHAEYPEVKFHRPEMPPAFGALVMGAFKSGANPGAYYGRIKKGYEEMTVQTVEQAMQRKNHLQESDMGSKSTRMIKLGKGKTRVDSYVFRKQEDLADSLSVRLADSIERASEKGRSFCLGCPTGRSPMLTYVKLGQIIKRRKMDVSRLVLVMMDEYLVKKRGVFELCPDSCHYSCRRFARDIILHAINGGLPPGKRMKEWNVWFPDPADPAGYDRRIAGIGGVDVFILAAGATDMHVAFNPPGSSAASRSRVIRINSATRRDNLKTFPDFRGLRAVPEYGVSVGLGTIAGFSKEVVMVIHGADKRMVVRTLAGLRGFNAAVPASIIYKCRHATAWLDEDAASDTGERE